MSKSNEQSISAPSALPNGTGMVFQERTGSLTYFLRGKHLAVGDPIWVKSVNQLGIIVSDCPCNRGTMHNYMTSTIAANPDNYILPSEAGYGIKA